MTSPDPRTVLVVDDDASMRRALAAALSRAGHDVTACAGPTEARGLLGRRPFDCVVSDLMMPDGSGVELLRWTRAERPDVPFILVTGYGEVQDAVEALKAGAEDFLLKPFELSVLEDRVSRALARGGAPSAEVEPGLVVASPSMRRILALARNVADSRATVLLVGESGTGKERIARYLHAASDRAAGPFVAVNCAAIPANLLESELFGHEKGAFSGADRRRIGRFEAASGGTLLLDEIGEMDLPLQAKLLRVLQEWEVDRVGGSRPVPVDVRVICTTHRDLRAMVDAGTFREDLYYRIHVFPLRLPPLRERVEDISELARHFVQAHAQSNRRPVGGLTDRALAALDCHPWPGNVRELENTLERAVLLCEGRLVDLPHLVTGEGRTLSGGMPQARGAAGEDEVEGALTVAPGTPLADIERELILRTLEATGGNRTRTSQLLGISIRTLRNRLRDYRQCGVAVPPPAAEAA